MKQWSAWFERKGLKLRNPIDQKDKEGLTALHYAARFNKVDILRLLLAEKPSELLFVNVGTPSIIFDNNNPLYYLVCVSVVRGYLRDKEIVL